MSDSHFISIRNGGEEPRALSVAESDSRFQLMDSITSNSVNIRVETGGPFTLEPRRNGIGTVLEDGTVLTNANLISNGRHITVCDASGRTHEAEVLRVRELDNLAVVKVNWQNGLRPQGARPADAEAQQGEVLSRDRSV